MEDKRASAISGDSWRPFFNFLFCVSAYSFGILLRPRLSILRRFLKDSPKIPQRFPKDSLEILWRFQCGRDPPYIPQDPYQILSPGFSSWTRYDGRILMASIWHCCVNLWSALGPALVILKRSRWTVGDSWGHLTQQDRSHSFKFKFVTNQHEIEVVNKLRWVGEEEGGVMTRMGLLIGVTFMLHISLHWFMRRRRRRRRRMRRERQEEAGGGRSGRSGSNFMFGALDEINLIIDGLVVCWLKLGTCVADRRLPVT